MISLYLQALVIMLMMGFVTWLYSLVKRDVSIVDVLWSLMLLAAAMIYNRGEWTLDGIFITALVAIWALRLSLHILIRNRGRGEDRRYAAIRARYSPHFEIKSLLIVFGLQAVLAWVVSLPLALAIGAADVMHWPTGLAVVLFLAGFLFESIADAQLTRFKADPANQGMVLNRGLWRYSRHPNYFGECLIWWAFWLMALPAGGWWTVVSPLLMTVLLLRVSGVTLLEHDISERRPGYVEYIKTTNAFIPGPPRTRPGHQASESKT